MTPPADHTEFEGGPEGDEPTGATPGKYLRSDSDLFEVLQVHRGGMGFVYICNKLTVNGRAAETDVLVALKTFDEAVFFDPATAGALAAETTLWIRLSNEPFVLPVYGRPVIDGKPHLLMPAILKNGAPFSLADLMAEPGPVSAAMAILLPLAIALDRCGRKVEGFVHGDIKPSNIMLSADGPLLADFGLAKAAGRRGLQGGTARYLAPEAVTGPATPASDIYGLGVLAFDLMGPVQAADPYDRDARRIFAQCLQLDPAERPTADELLAMLSFLAMQNEPFRVFGLLGKLREQPVEQLIQAVGAQAQALIDAGDGEAALALIGDAAADHGDANLHRLRGNALAVIGDNEEALVAFQTAEGLTNDADLRHLILSDTGLSLRRLGRLEAARALYEDLLPHVTGDLREMVAGNLARVLIDLRQFSPAANRLRRLTWDNPGRAVLWFLLGMAERGAGRPLAAAEALRRGLALDPRDRQGHEFLGEVLMADLRQFHEAWISFDLAFRLGDWDLNLAEAALCCLDLTGDVEERDALVEALRDSIGQAETTAMLDRARARSKRLRAGPEPAGGDENEDALEGVEAAEPPEMEGTRGIGNGPFITVRLEADGAVVVDFYRRPSDAPAYPEEFAVAFSGAMSRTEGFDDVRQLRSGPFQMARCPGCGWDILTLRDAGDPLRCRGCGETRPVTPVQTVATAGVLDACETRLGRVIAPVGAGRVFISAFAAPEDDVDAFDAALQARGFERLADDRVIHIRIAMEAYQRGLTRAVRPSAVWMRAADPMELGVRGLAPRSAERAIYAARRSVRRPPRTMIQLEPEAQVGALLAPQSTIVDEFEILSETDIAADVEKACRAAVSLAQDDRTAAAQALLDRILRRFPEHPAVGFPRGVLALQAKAFDAAIADLERAARAFPRDLSMGFTLGAAYMAAGQGDAAAAELARIRALGFIAPDPPNRPDE